MGTSIVAGVDTLSYVTFENRLHDLTIRRHQIFLGGSSDENEKVLGKFLARLRRAKKGVPKFFACGGLFFVVEALKTVKKPLKPLKNR